MAIITMLVGLGVLLAFTVLGCVPVSYTHLTLPTTSRV